MYELLVTVGSAMGLAVVLLGFSDGPGAWVRESIMRPLLSLIRGAGVLDCAACFSFWSGLLAGAAGWLAVGRPDLLLASLIAPLLFWLRPGSPTGCGRGRPAG